MRPDLATAGFVMYLAASGGFIEVFSAEVVLDRAGWGGEMASMLQDFLRVRVIRRDSVVQSRSRSVTRQCPNWLRPCCERMVWISRLNFRAASVTLAVPLRGQPRAFFIS
jgi:hypothetical protein